MKNIFEAIERKPIQAILGLLFFHIAFACLMSWIAYSPYLTHLHNGQGFWNFASDSILYHQEAIYLVDALNSGNWSKWWSGIFLDGSFKVQHVQVKWIALIYRMSGEEYPLLFEIVNSVTWVASVVLIFLAARIYFPNNKTTANFAVFFLFFPSVLFSSAQLLREPFYILGFCFVIFGWVAIFHEDSKWKGAFAIVTGFYLITAVRLYVTPVLLSAFLICTVVLMLRKKLAHFPAFIMLMGISLISFQAGYLNIPVPGPAKINSSLTDQNKKITEHLTNSTTERSTMSFLDIALDIWKTTGEHSKETIISNTRKDEEDIQKLIFMKQQELIKSFRENNSSMGFISYLNNKIAIKISFLRHGFVSVNKNARSAIDENVQFMNLRDLFSYFPRALQIGFLSPFPQLWVSSGTSTGYIGRIVAGFETLIMYVVLVGFFSAFFIEIQILKPLAPVLIFSTVMIILLGFVVPNAGTIYRMRQGLFIPFFVIGVYGLQLLMIKIKNILLKYKFCKSQ